MIDMTDERIYEIAKRHFGGRGHSLIWQDDPRYAASCEMEKDARWSVSSVRAEQTLAFARSILAVSTEKTAPQLMESGPTGTDGSQKPNDAAAIPCAKAGSINSLPDSEIERIYRAEWYDSPVVARKAPSPPPLVFRFARACITAHEAKKQQVHLVSASGGGTVPGDAPCSKCGGTGVVDDGYIDCSDGGIPFENGPIKCVKDCPACGGRIPGASVAQAEFARDEDDELLIEWSPAKGRMVFLSLRADGRLSYAIKWDDESAHGQAQMPAALTPPAAPQEPSKAAQDVLAERQRQIEAEGWDAAHDDEHWGGSMAVAAACYALGNDGVSGTREFVSLWPWDRADWKPKDERRNLVRAGALILAEIERLDRAAMKAQPSAQAEMQDGYGVKESSNG